MPPSIIFETFLKKVDKIFGGVKIFDYLCNVIQKELKAVRRREVMLITRTGGGDPMQFVAKK